MQTIRVKVDAAMKICLQGREVIKLRTRTSFPTQKSSTVWSAIVLWSLERELSSKNVDTNFVGE